MTPLPGPEDLVRETWSESQRFLPRTVVQPVQRFLQASAAGALVMVAAAVAALLLANSSWAVSYQALWDTTITLRVGGWDTLSGLSLREWVNDGAMTSFFFLVALEIKRELVAGDLRNARAAALPLIAAVGGMIVPAIIFATLNPTGPGQVGWGIPMATDIAFAVAVVTAAGPHVPHGARLFLLTLAIVDDLGGIIVIAVFYTHGLAVMWLLAALAAAFAAWGLQHIHVRAVAPYVVLASVCWFALFQSGVHPTLAGVAFGFLTPTWSFYEPRLVSTHAHDLTRTSREAFSDAPSENAYDVARAALRDMRRLAREAEAPLDRLEWRLAPWVTFLVVPLFAFVNAGLTLPGDVATAWLHDRVSLGVVLGLLLGKPVGVFAAAWVATRTPWALMPVGMTDRHLFGVSTCAGVGFTVALFVSGLAFQPGPLADAARLGIFIGSMLAGTCGYLILRTSPKAVPGE